MKWNEITWYSRLGAILVCFGVIPVLAFYIGIKYATLVENTDGVSEVTYVSPIQRTTLFEFLSPQEDAVLNKNEAVTVSWTPIEHPEGKIAKLWLYGLNEIGIEEAGVELSGGFDLSDGTTEITLTENILIVLDKYPKYRLVLDIGHNEKQGPGVMGFVTDQMIKGPELIVHSGENAAAACYRGGCSQQICSDQPDIASTCEYKEEYACYQSATCERQANGQCGWTQTEQLRLCLAYGQCDGEFCP